MKIKFEKTFIKTALTLGIIAMVSGGLISLTYGVTHDQVVRNTVEKKNQAKGEIFKDLETEGLKVTFSKDVAVKDDNFKSIVEYSDATLDGKKVGRVYFTSGANDYGKISLMVGVYDENPDLKSPISVIENTQTYASTLEDNFIIPYIKGHKDLSNEDVTCGASFGAKLIRSMILEAKEYHKLSLESKGV